MNLTCRDNVEWDEEQRKLADEKVAANSRVTMSEEEKNAYENNAAGHWDSFYTTHQREFFKDRHWLFTEFSELLASDVNQFVESDQSERKSERSTFKIFEIGCGVGNTIFPILEMNL